LTVLNAVGAFHNAIIRMSSQRVDGGAGFSIKRNANMTTFYAKFFFFEC
jgi:hypothetical protein